MIQTGNKEIDNVIAVLLDQRNAAMDTVAILSGKLLAAETRASSAEIQLKKLTAPSESGVAG